MQAVLMHAPAEGFSLRQDIKSSTNGGKDGTSLMPTLEREADQNHTQIEDTQTQNSNTIDSLNSEEFLERLRQSPPKDLIVSSAEGLDFADDLMHNVLVQDHSSTLAIIPEDSENDRSNSQEEVEKEQELEVDAEEEEEDVDLSGIQATTADEKCVVESDVDVEMLPQKRMKLNDNTTYVTKPLRQKNRPRVSPKQETDESSSNEANQVETAIPKPANCKVVIDLLGDSDSDGGDANEMQKEKEKKKKKTNTSRKSKKAPSAKHRNAVRNTVQRTKTKSVDSCLLTGLLSHREPVGLNSRNFKDDTTSTTELDLSQDTNASLNLLLGSSSSCQQQCSERSSQEEEEYDYEDEDSENELIMNMTMGLEHVSPTEQKETMEVERVEQGCAALSIDESPSRKQKKKKNKKKQTKQKQKKKNKDKENHNETFHEDMEQDAENLQQEEEERNSHLFDASLPPLDSVNWRQVFSKLNYSGKHEHFFVDNLHNVHPRWSSISNAAIHRLYQHSGFYVLENDNLKPSNQQRSKPNQYTSMLKFGETHDFIKRMYDGSFTSCFFPGTWRILLFIETNVKANAQRIESRFKDWLKKRQRFKNDVYVMTHKKDVILCKNWNILRNDFLRNIHPNNMLKDGTNFVRRFGVQYVGVGKQNDWLLQAY